MAIIDGNRKICNLINVFTVDPDKHSVLLENLLAATENVMCRQPGYISANLHSSNDKKTITNYAQWAYLEDFQQMQKNEEAIKRMKAAAAIAEKFEPVTCDLIWTHLNTG